MISFLFKIILSIQVNVFNVLFFQWQPLEIIVTSNRDAKVFPVILSRRSLVHSRLFLISHLHVFGWYFHVFTLSWLYFCVPSLMLSLSYIFSLACFLPSLGRLFNGNGWLLHHCLIVFSSGGLKQRAAAAAW